MKKRILIFISINALLIGFFATAGFRNFNHFTEVEGYTTASTPTTINLNDTSETTIRNYYSNLDSLSSSERQGTDLLKNLKPILKNGQKYLNYDSGKTIWNLYEIADRDWSLSPASAIPGYNSSTNTITGYVYGTSGDNPYLHSLYVNRDVPNQTHAWGDHTQTNWGINREHIWPKSQGFEDTGSGGARGDPMHLWSANGYVNNIHSNYFFGFVDQNRISTNCGNKYSFVSHNMIGISNTMGSKTVFEPQDSDKGDIARAVFYMAARYNYYSGSDSDGINSNNPNLELVQNSTYTSSGYQSTTTLTGKMGILSDLLAWNHLDPVDEYEIHRNNLLFNNYTNNRNPFIDFPEWADYIWGTANLDGSGYSSQVKGYASPTTDTINGLNHRIQVTGVLLNKNSANLNINESITLIASISPNDASDQSVNWLSNNEEIATVAGGVVTAVAAGNAIITVTTSDGSFTATCEIVVSSDVINHGGCKGSIAITSALIAIISAIGVTFILIKRKKYSR